MRLRFFLHSNLVLIALSLIMTASCRNKAQIKHNEVVRHQTDISVEAKVVSHDITSSSGDDMTYLLKEESDGEIVIEPTSGYFDKYVSKDRMELGVENEGGWCDYLNYPQVEFFITNNSDEILNVSSLKVMVEKSKPDKLPYLFLYQDEDYANSIFIWN